MGFRLSFYSKTQSIIGTAPNIVALIAFVTAPAAMSPEDFAQYFGPLVLAVLGSFCWLVVWMALSGHLYRRGITSLAGIDFSKNVVPTRAEALGLKVNVAISGALAGGGLLYGTVRLSLIPDMTPMALLVLGTFLLASAVLGFLFCMYVLTLLQMLLTGFRFRPVKDAPTRV